MVVTRRVPAPPAPPTSRTTSTQNLPRASRLVPQKPDARLESAQSVRQRAQPSAPQSVGKGRPSKRRKRPQPLVSSFPRIIFALFLLYAWSTLHHFPAQSLRGALSVPHDNLIKPYILPPLQAALSHPVVEPHVVNLQANIQPYVQRVERVAYPALEKLSRLEENRIRPLVRLVTIATSRAAQKIWYRMVVPSYNTFLRPRVQPYLDRFDSFFHGNVEPRLRTFVLQLAIRYYKVKPRVDNARTVFWRYSSAAYSQISPRIQKFYSTVKPRVIAFWARAQPHLREGYKVFKIEATRGFSAVKLYTSVATTKLGDARREFVDPHIKRIWEKVEPRPSTSTNTTGAVPASLGEMPTISSASPSVSMTVASSEILSDTDSPTLPPPVTNPLATSHLEPEDIQGVGDTLESTTSIVSESIGLGAATKEFGNTGGDSSDLPTNTAVSSIAATKSEATETLSPTIIVESETRDASGNAEDVDDFLQELGISSDEESDIDQPTSLNSDEESTQSVLSTQQEEEAAAAFREKVAAKRAAIVKRHEDWQAQMDSLVQARERDLRKALVSLRKKAVEELTSLTLRSAQEGKEGEKVIESIEQEASRLERGLEGYIKKDHDRKAKLGQEWFGQLDDKKSQWEKILNKVGAKFADKVRAVQEEVLSWYTGAREKEGDEVLVASAELRSLAETAQADIGMDYAWLEDVTYDDWQKYHDLMRTAQRFEETARAIQNGTHSHPPVDPLASSIEAFERQVQELIDGFNARMSMLRSEGNNLYTTAGSEMPSNSVPSSTASEPTMSILPIKDAHVEEASNIILSKSEEQIKQGLDAAGFAVGGKVRAQAEDHVEL